jgi:exopolyphosphatase/guanosine-5'-triphosphate,3'-diphosphate pyrophosphatase
MANAGQARPARIGVLDVGSNTVLLLVLEADGRVLRDAAHITRLGQGVFTSGALAPEATLRTRAAIAEFAALARADGAERVVAVGTEALRRARDGAEFLARLVREGLVDAARLLSGEEEAAVTVEATRLRVGATREALAVIDVGGGSTEVAWRLRAHAPISGLSLPIGSVRLTEALLPRHPVPEADRARLRAELRRATEPLAVALPQGLPADAAVVAVAATATTLAALELALARYDAERIEGHEVDTAALAAWTERLAGLGVAERKQLPGLEPARAEVIVAGLAVLHAVLERLRVRRFAVSGRGVRHGVALRVLAGQMVI